VEAEEDAPFSMNIVFDEFNPPTGVPGTKSENMTNDFEHLQQKQKSLGDQPWAPFTSIEDWDYARWIVEDSDLSQKQIDAMLALDLVSRMHTLNISRKSADTTLRRPFFSYRSWPTKQD
jgi:hypothetical protein